MIPFREKHGRRISQLCLGTVQLGMPYGIANVSGMPDEAVARELVIAAADAGVTLCDTARAYGESESRLGKALANVPHLTVATKLSPLEELSEGDAEKTVVGKVEESVYTSLRCLGISTLPYLLLHRAYHLYSHGGTIWRALLRLREEGVIERLGVSVQSPQETLDALAFPEVECIQLPFNVLDRRYENAGIPALLHRRPEILVMARSALLQGLLTQEVGLWTVLQQEAAAITGALDQFAAEFGRMNRVDLCLAFVRAQPWIDCVVIGVDNILQLNNNINLFSKPLLSEEACAAIRRRFLYTEEAMLNPACWPKAKQWRPN